VTESLITAAIVAGVLGLIKAVEYLLTKLTKSKSSRGLTEKQDKSIEETFSYVTSMAKYGAMTREQQETIEEIRKMAEHLDELHSVYDNNHVPKWYVPSDLTDRLGDIGSRLQILSERQTENLEEIKTAQGALIQKIADLISSQNRMTDRLGDLVAALNRRKD